MFACPNCQSTLTRVQGKVGIYWTCANCGGRATNVAVLRRAAAADFVNHLWSQVREQKGVNGRSCPTCSQAMLEVMLPAPPNALKIDVCRRCEMVWFDPGELESVAAAPPTPSQLEMREQLPEKAREQLALYKVRMLNEKARSDRWNAALMNQPYSNWDADWTTISASVLDLFV